MNLKTISLIGEKAELRYYFKRSDLRVSLYARDSQYRDPSHLVPDLDVITVDIVGRLDADLRSVIERSDVVVVPVRPTPSYTRPFLRTIDLVRNVAPDAPLVICVNGLNTFKIATAFSKWLSVRISGTRR